MPLTPRHVPVPVIPPQFRIPALGIRLPLHVPHAMPGHMPVHGDVPVPVPEIAPGLRIPAMGIPPAHVLQQLPAVPALPALPALPPLPVLPVQSALLVLRASPVLPAPALQRVQALPVVLAAGPNREKDYRPGAQVQALAKARNLNRPVHEPPLLISLENGEYEQTVLQDMRIEWPEQPQQVQTVLPVDTCLSESCRIDVSECLVSSSFAVCVALVGYSVARGRCYMLHIQTAGDILKRVADWDPDMTVMLVYKKYSGANEERMQDARKNLLDKGVFRGVVAEGLDWLDCTTVIMYRYTCIAFKQTSASTLTLRAQWLAQRAIAEGDQGSAAAGSGRSGSAAAAATYV